VVKYRDFPATRQTTQRREKPMSEETIKTLMRDAVASLCKGDVEKGLSFFAEDATWVTPEGTFQGKEELRRYLTWMAGVPDLTYTETGIGILVQGNQAVFEHLFEGTYEGTRCKWLALCAWEFSDGKIQRMRTVYDRLSILDQAAKGWLEHTIVSSLVNRAEKGLH
jgi:ketosteroid isomerase-like protein